MVRTGRDSAVSVQRGAAANPASADGRRAGGHARQVQQLSFTLLLLLALLYPIALTATSLSHPSPHTHTLRRLHTNEAEEGGGLSLPIAGGEGVARGCSASPHYK